MPAKSVPLRRLGKDGPLVPALGFGLMVMAGAYGTPPNDEERFQILDHSLKLGEMFWDTADIYGDTEELLGKWFQRTGKRSEIFLASKFGIVMENLQFKGINSSAEYCKRACEASLKKLATDYIDLYYAHRVNPETPIEETMRAMVELQAAGKIKHIGLSGVNSNTLRRAYKIATVAAVQMEYSPFLLDIEQPSGSSMLETCRELGVAVVCYSPLGRGLLTGTLTGRQSVTGANDLRATHFPRFGEENLEGNVKLVNQLKALAEKKGCTASQLTIAWILKQGNDMIPIPGTKKIKYLEENWNSLDVHLSDDEEVEIRKLVESFDILGFHSTPAAKIFDSADTKEEV